VYEAISPEVSEVYMPVNAHTAALVKMKNMTALAMLEPKATPNE
jgi:hypothetical protein